MTYLEPQSVVRQLRPPKPAPAGVTAAALRAKTFKPISWVVPDLIPDGLTILAAKPKIGKSWLMLDVATAIARGGYVFSRKCAEGDALYCALEDNERRLKGRMGKLLQLGGEWPARLTFWTEMEKVEEGGLDQLREWVASVTNPRLIVIDVFSKVRRAKRASEGVYDADYLAASPLKRLADETGVAVVLIHHLRKGAADDDPFDAVSGSTGLTGAADTIFVLTRGSEGVTLYGRGRDVEESENAVEFDRHSCRWSILGAAREVRISAERRAIIDALRAQSEPMSPADITDVTGSSRVATRRLLFSMAQNGEVVRVQRGKYSLPINPPNIGNNGNNGRAMA